MRFSAHQLILLDEQREYDLRLDDVMKAVILPAWQAETLASPLKGLEGNPSNNVHYEMTIKR